MGRVISKDPGFLGSGTTSAVEIAAIVAERDRLKIENAKLRRERDEARVKARETAHRHIDEIQKELDRTIQEYRDWLDGF